MGARKTEDFRKSESPPGPRGGLISLQIKRVCSLEREIVLGRIAVKDSLNAAGFLLV